MAPAGDPPQGSSVTQGNPSGSRALAGPRNLTILGASARAAAQSAARAGFRPLAADLFGDSDLQACAAWVPLGDYPRGASEALAQAPACPWLYTGGLENYSSLVAQLELIRPLYGNGHRVLDRVRDPWQVAAALNRHGLGAPALAATAEHLPIDGSWLCKGRRSAGGLHVTGWHGPVSDAPTAADNTHYFQQRVLGQAVSGLYLAAGGRARLLGLAEQILADRHGRPDWDRGGSPGETVSAMPARSGLWPRPTRSGALSTKSARFWRPNSNWPACSAWMRSSPAIESGRWK